MRGSDDDADAPAPLFGTWPRWYALVLTTLGALVATFAWLAHHYR